MRFGKSQILIQEQSLEKVKIILQEFENKYQNYKSRWDFEIAGQKDNMVYAQLVDHSYETPRGKGQSDSPIYRIALSQSGTDVLLTRDQKWKKSKRLFSWSVLAALAACRILIFLFTRGDKMILYLGIWLFAAILYAGWIFQNMYHSHNGQEMFEEMLYSNFSTARKAEPQPGDPSAPEKPN